MKEQDFSRSVTPMISILYVDDEPGLLEIGKLFLENTGIFSVKTVTSATEALEILRSGVYGAIISDYQMPDMNGIEFLRQVRASGNPIPFIIFTGRGREEVVIQALNEGADFYIQKGGEPVSQFTELAHKVHKAILHKKAEASVREHERRETDIINFLPDATFAIDTSGVVIAWNRAMEKMTGVKSEQVLGKGNYEYAIPFYHERRPILIDLVLDYDPAIANKYQDIQKDGKNLFSEITIPHFHEGRGAALWFTASPLYDTQGTIVGAIESIREITERKRAEEALNESERRFRELSDMLPQVVYEADAGGNVTYANRIAFEMFGYTEEKIKSGVNVLEIIAPEDRDRVATAFRLILNGGSRKHSSEEYLELRSDGSTFPASIYSSPVLQDGRIVGVRGILVDITDRKLAEERVRESEQNYRLLFENATEGILVAQGDRMVNINPALINLLDRPADVITSRPFTDFIHPDDRELVMGRHIQRMKGETPYTGYMFRIITGAGHEKWVWINSTRMTWSGNPASLSFLTDMTERKAAEESLISANNEYTNLLNQIQDIYYRSDAEGRLIKASRSWAALLGYDDLSECLGRSIADDFYANPGDRKKFLEEIHTEGKVTNYEVQLKKKDGTPVIVATSSHLYFDPSGNVLGLEGTFRDITERKRQESILQSQFELGLKLQKTLDMNETLDTCLSSAIEISGMDSGGFYFIDEMTGSADLVLSRNLGSGFIASASRYTADSANAKIVMEQKPVWVPFDAMGVDHNDIQTAEGLRAIAILPITSGGRSIACLEVSSHTLSEISKTSRVALETIATQIGVAIERKRAEEALAESEQRYRNVVEDQTEFISRFLPDGTHVFVNDAYCRYFGLAREEILGHRFQPLIPAEDRERVRRFFGSLTRDNPVDTIEHRILMPDGRLRWQRWSDRAIFDPSGILIEYQSVGRDITDTKVAEEALRESEERFRGMAERSSDLIFILDQAMSISYVSPSARSIIGYEPEELVGKPVEFVYSTIFSDSRPAFENALRANKRGVTIENFEMQIRKKDGDIVYVNVHALPVMHDGAFAGAQVSMGNITAWKRSERALRESDERYRSLSEASRDLIFVIDRDDRITYVNNSAAQMFGISAGDLIGRKRSELFPSDISEGQLRAIRKVFETGEGIRSTGKLGLHEKMLWFDHSLMPVRNESGEITQVLGISRDITEQKRVEEALRTRTDELDTRNRVLNTLLDTVPIGIFMVEVPSGTPIVANQEATRLLGRGILPDATEENLGRVYEAFQAGSCKQYPTEEMPIVRGMRGESSHVDDMVVVRPDETRVQLEIFGNPVLDQQNRVIASIVSFLDVTKRKREEQLLLETNKKINLLGSITRHDVANQVSIMRGYAKIAMMDNRDPAIEDLLSKIDSAGSVIMQQIDFTNAYGKLGLNSPEWYRISGLVDQMNPEHIALTCDCNNTEILADPMLEKVFFNLVDNAIRHGERVTEITVRCETGPSGLSVFVEDDGIGIPPDKKERIFEKGYGKNTGLGLFLAREILAITGISIRETGAPGKGARFELQVPRRKYRSG
jgi:PAS domain S-box-containing protein